MRLEFFWSLEVQVNHQSFDAMIMHGECEGQGDASLDYLKINIKRFLGVAIKYLLFDLMRIAKEAGKTLAFVKISDDDTLSCPLGITRFDGVVVLQNLIALSTLHKCNQLPLDSNIIKSLQIPVLNSINLSSLPSFASL